MFLSSTKCCLPDTSQKASLILMKLSYIYSVQISFFFALTLFKGAQSSEKVGKNCE